MKQSILFVLIICSLATIFSFRNKGSYHTNNDNSLLQAITLDDTALIRNLLMKGSNPNAVDDDSDNALMYAALYCQPYTTGLLLSFGAFPDLKNKAGETAIMWSVNDIDMTLMLINKGADVNAISTVGNSALMIAVTSQGNAKIVKLLLDKNADASIKNMAGETVLMRAAAGGDTAILKILLNKHIDINAGNKFTTTALSAAVANKNTAAAILLLNNGADPNKADGLQTTPLMFCINLDDLQLVNALLQHGADVNKKDHDGYTALMWAVYNEHDNPAIINAILKKEAIINLKGNDGATALSLAEKKGNTETVALLKQSGAK